MTWQFARAIRLSGHLKTTRLSCDIMQGKSGLYGEKASHMRVTWVLKCIEKPCPYQRPSLQGQSTFSQDVSWRSTITPTASTVSAQRHSNIDIHGYSGVHKNVWPFYVPCHWVGGKWLIVTKASCSLITHSKTLSKFGFLSSLALYMVYRLRYLLGNFVSWSSEIVTLPVPKCTYQISLSQKLSRLE